MAFYEFRQNNSGGGFDIEPEQGISVHVIVEATDADEANSRAECIGLYFNGCDYGRDCPCCGDRWYAQWREDGTEVPSIYGTAIEEAETLGGGWAAQDVPEAYVHYLDGRVEGYVIDSDRYVLKGS